MIHGELKIIYHDQFLVIADKPGGLLSVPGRGADKQDCVTSRLRNMFPEMIEQPAVHRLDMYTSGLLVVAVTRESHRHLNRQFMDRTVIKHYQAIVEGEIHGDSGEIRLPFRLDPANRPLQVYDPQQGKMGVTTWTRLSREAAGTRIRFVPLTGRTHQLRVHAAHHLGLCCPIVGDSLYGCGSDGDRMLLHAEYLEFTHPESNKRVHFHVPAPF
ncbi:RluA family pseudouridine synthase [Desulfopila sp. IMCC35008]|uniref:RluA family pseudouridine synthase n=1 Tax=Desulfopila sp. IMCC35008 TaxID=2653858 RepID=UPI0013D55A81|nr:RluA family pseudouridine synthase [Desulfopila sp. IMCC35008]